MNRIRVYFSMRDPLSMISNQTLMCHYFFYSFFFKAERRRITVLSAISKIIKENTISLFLGVGRY